MLPQPDETFARLDSDLAGRKVIIRFETDPDDDLPTKRLSWAFVPMMSRMEIGMAAQDLNRACIDWRGLESIHAVVATADELRNQRRQQPAPTPQPELAN